MSIDQQEIEHLNKVIDTAIEWLSSAEHHDLAEALTRLRRFESPGECVTCGRRIPPYNKAIYIREKWQSVPDLVCNWGCMQLLVENRVTHGH